MTTEFTPGPWFHGEMYGWAGVCITRKHPSEYGPQGTVGDCPIAQVRDKAPHWENSYPVEANARLISAAPEMFEALERMLANYRSDGSEGAARDIELARAALAKARGETP